MDDNLHTPLIQPITDPVRPVSEKNPPYGKRSGCTMFCILLTVCLERAAYYTLLGNLAVFLCTELHWSAGAASACVLGFYGLTWVSCFIGGILGDVLLGRFSTISTGLVLYVVGFISLPLISFLVTRRKVDGNGIAEVFWLLLALLVISLGEGFFKANMAPFGADQIARAGETRLRSFFSIFYWSINIGGLVGYGPMSYLLEHGKGFMKGYIVAVCIIATAGLVFLMPKRYLYPDSRPPTNVLSRIWQVTKNAISNRKQKKQNGSAASPSYEDFVPHQHWLDRAMIKYGGKHLDIEVEEVKALYRVLPVFGFLLIYCSLYYQISGTFLLQGINMNTNLGQEFSIPAAWLSLFNIIFVLIFVPIVDKGLYPALEKCGFKVSHKIRMAIGMIIASGAMVMAGMVELWRMDAPGVVNVTINGEMRQATDMTILYQIPQYGLIGISEIFVLITGLEFAYTSSPKSMQSIVTGMFFMANGIGSFLGMIMLLVAGYIHYGFPTYYRHTMKVQQQGRLYDFFFFLAVLNGVNWLGFVIYIIRARKKSKSKSMKAFLRTQGSDWKNSLEHLPT